MKRKKGTNNNFAWGCRKAVGEGSKDNLSKCHNHISWYENLKINQNITMNTL